ncbi:DUF7696 family protein [Alcaligenes endophyticus]|uniref:Uncharacterized protein n=1 Tax=Alcaligenes endophyticus TaxID=1929088 RepID=A0ABT8EJ31_9BURK|nr:hypothetical protein [Alcaligenes endophyticus]MCX5592514.1 hypothetical protein [Alcaligenes endophyticus]MDN4121240.1 hypothetical protein [Alcaligenes endophyticus]
MKTQTEQHRHECEARYVLNLPFADRKPYLEGIGRRRGEVAKAALESEVRKQYKLRKEAA